MARLRKVLSGLTFIIVIRDIKDSLYKLFRGFAFYDIVFLLSLQHPFFKGFTLLFFFKKITYIIPDLLNPLIRKIKKHFIDVRYFHSFHAFIIKEGRFYVNKKLISKIISIILLQILSWLSAAYAQEGSGVQFNGYVEAENKTYFKEVNPEHVDNGRNQMIFFLKSSAAPNEKVKLFSAIEIRDDEVNHARNRVWLDEAYIDYEGESFDLRIGKQVYGWGKADSINPTNNLNPVDYSDLLDTDEEEIGMTSLRGRYYLGNWTFEGAVIPVFEPSILPNYNSRWNLFPKALSALPVQTREPSKEFQNIQYAGRVSSTFNGLDFSVSYYRGFEKFPSVFVKSNSVIMEYRSLQVIGGDFAASFDKLGIRGEAGYFITDDFDGKIPEVSDPYLMYVLGLDYKFSNLIEEQDLYILCQWIQTLPLPERDSLSESDLRYLFKRAVMLKADWSFTDYTKFSFQGIWRLHAEDIFLQPMLSSNLSDGLNLEVGADLLYGKEGSFFESFKDNQRIFARLKYSF
ncbi:MAG: hypothetical protein HY279_11320 [Nitrospinae bacterium]|nr:hypothetical protein [Nitrospinota bacterium]